MPQLDLGIYFLQILLNFWFFWFFYFFIGLFVLGDLSNIIKIKKFIFLNNNSLYLSKFIFYHITELKFSQNTNWSNFHSLILLFSIFIFKNDKILYLLNNKSIKVFFSNLMVNSLCSISNKVIIILNLMTTWKR